MDLLALVGVPAVIWIISYAYLAIYHRKWNLLQVVIHETGRYSLLQTVFYFNHFLREIILDTLFAGCIFWAYLVIHPGLFSLGMCGYFQPYLLVLYSFVILVLGASFRTVGLKNTFLDLLQFRERDDVVRFGSHWQMHFLSSLAIMLILVFPATFFDIRETRLIGGVFLLFLALSLLFRTSRKALLDRRWLLHGGRETVTYSLIVGVPAFGSLLLRMDDFRLQASVWSCVTMTLILLLLAFPMRVLLKSELSDLAQGGYGFLYLLASHFFEHFLDYVYILLLVLVLVARQGCVV